MLRCPHCGQSYFASCFDGMLELQIALDGKSILCEAGLLDLDLFLPEEKLNCPRCNKMNSFTKWRACWNDPLPFLELEKEEICRCGGEYVYNVSIHSARIGKLSSNLGKIASPIACEVCGLPPGRDPLKYPTLNEISFDEEEPDEEGQS